MPPPSSRMTKNRAQPARYRPGKAEAADPESEDESSEEEEDNDERPTTATARAPPPKATTFPRKLAFDVSKAGQQPTATPQAKPPEEDLEGFVTASESSEDEDAAKGSSDDSGSEEDDSSEEEDSSSDDEPAKPMLRPTFMSKAKRAQQQQQQQQEAAPSAEEKASTDAVLRQEKTDALLAAHLARDAAARAAGKKFWDDEDVAPEDAVDDTDDVDPEAELAAWKLRELKRVRRERAGIEAKEKEREEVERRRNLSAEEREREDAAFIAAQKEGREGKGKMGFMQKYFHKGAFFGGEDGEEGEGDEEVKAALNRDLAGARFEDEAGDKSLLPEYMRVRDMTRLGRKGRSKYKDLKSEDTGRWGAEVGQRRKRDFEGDGLDERFRPDGQGGGREGATGANSAALGERKKARYE